MVHDFSIVILVFGGKKRLEVFNPEIWWFRSDVSPFPIRWFLRWPATVDASEIRPTCLRLVVYPCLSHYLQGEIAPSQVVQIAGFRTNHPTVLIACCISSLPGVLIGIREQEKWLLTTLVLRRSPYFSWQSGGQKDIKRHTPTTWCVSESVNGVVRPRYHLKWKRNTSGTPLQSGYDSFSSSGCLMIIWRAVAELNQSRKK